MTNPGQFYACCGLLELATALHPGDRVTGRFTSDRFVASTDVANVLAALVAGEIKVNALAESSARVRGGASHKVSPMSVLGVLTLDWWLDASSADFKTWAGGMSAPLTVAALQQSLRDADLGSDPFDAATPSTAATFCFDCRMGGDARDIGFSFEQMGFGQKHPLRKPLTYPAVRPAWPSSGLQRCQAAKGDVSRRIKSYCDLGSSHYP